MHQNALKTQHRYNNSLYVFGGYDGQQRLNDFWQFKLATEVNIDIPCSSLVRLPDSPYEHILTRSNKSTNIYVHVYTTYTHKFLPYECAVKIEVSDLRDFLNDAKLSDVTFVVEGKAVGPWLAYKTFFFYIT